MINFMYHLFIKWEVDQSEEKEALKQYDRYLKTGHIKAIKDNKVIMSWESKKKYHGEIK